MDTLAVANSKFDKNAAYRSGLFSFMAGNRIVLTPIANSAITFISIGSLKLQCALWICTVRATVFDIYRYITGVKKTNIAVLTVHFH